MNRRKIVFQILILALAVVLIASASAPAAVEGAPPKTVALASAESEVLVIPAAAFSSDGYDANSFFFTFSGGYIRGTDAHDGCVKAPVYLPKWARVYEAWASVYDNDSTYNLSADVRRVDNFTGAAAVMANMVTSGASSYIQTPYDFSITNPLILYPDYSYYVTTCLLSSNIRLYSVRIWYHQPNSTYLPILLQK